MKVIEAAPAFDESLEASLRALAVELGLSAGALFGLLRLAVTGQPVSPPLLESMALIGKPIVMARIAGVATRLEAMAG